MAQRTLVALAAGVIRPSTARQIRGPRFRSPCTAGLRFYATHSEKPSSFASGSGSSASGSASTSSRASSSTDPRTAELFARLESEAQRRSAREAMGGGERVGPFPLGVGPSGRNKTWRKWSELGIGGKREQSIRWRKLWAAIR